MEFSTAISTYTNAEGNDNQTISNEKSLSNGNNEAIYINARSVIKNLAKIETMMVRNKPAILMCSVARVTDKLLKNEYNIEHYKVIECFSQTRSTVY